jgi:hypothetical protein
MPRTPWHWDFKSKQYYNWKKGEKNDHWLQKANTIMEQEQTNQEARVRTVCSQKKKSNLIKECIE